MKKPHEKFCLLVLVLILVPGRQQLSVVEWKRVHHPTPSRQESKEVPLHYRFRVPVGHRGAVPEGDVSIDP
ncbi:hypothetical protein B0O80DRAFT_441482 [Mortierella sp. GBAus27b]|nr:hypothetical protein B0O80DRAFT_441482 [Mortierella sp. GBAus27b]